MRHARRLIAILVSCAAYCAAAATVAYARPDPGGGVIVYPPSTGTAGATETSIWQFIAVAALGALLAVAIVGLVLSLRQRRRSSEPSQILRA